MIDNFQYRIEPIKNLIYNWVKENTFHKKDLTDDLFTVKLGSIPNMVWLTRLILICLIV